ncbi:unnamed protein product, partial [marine sediment metagenome]
MSAHAIFQSEYSRRIAHHLDDSLERWRLRRGSSPHFNSSESDLLLGNFDAKYIKVVNMVKKASTVKNLRAAKKEAQSNLSLAEEKRKALKVRIRLSSTPSEMER